MTGCAASAVVSTRVMCKVCRLAGQKLHQHSGANKAKMERVLQQLVTHEEDPSFGSVFKRQVWHAKLGLT